MLTTAQEWTPILSHVKSPLFCLLLENTVPASEKTHNMYIFTAVRKIIVLRIILNNKHKYNLLKYVVY